MRLGNLLREFEIRSDTIRFPTGQAKGYTRADFTDAWNRYCPEPKSTTGEAVPTTQAVPTLTRENETGTAGTPWTPRAVRPPADDEGTHVLPTSVSA
jgi:hypothetical protein